MDINRFRQCSLQSLQTLLTLICVWQWIEAAEWFRLRRRRMWLTCSEVRGFMVEMVEKKWLFVAVCAWFEF